MRLVHFTYDVLAAPKVGQRTEGGRVYLLRERVEPFWNDWTAVKVSGRKGDQTDVHIRAEGKILGFEGIVSINCPIGSGSFCKNTSNFGKGLSEGATADTVPLEVIASAKKLLC